MTRVLDIIIGSSLIIISTVFSNYSQIIQKQAINTFDSASEDRSLIDIRALLKNKRWVAGIILMLIAGVPFLFGVPFIGISVAQPLTAIGYLVIAWFGIKILNEKLTRMHYLAIIILMVMPLFLSLASVSNVTIDVLSNENVGAFIMVLLVFASIILVQFILTQLKSIRVKINFEWMQWATLSGSCYAFGAILLQATFSALSSGGLEFIRDAGRLLPLLFQGNESVMLAAVIAVLSLIVNFLGLFFMQVGYKKGDATNVYPVAQSVNILLSVTIGIFVFGQVINSWFFYMLALVFTVFGTLILGKYQGALEKQGSLNHAAVSEEKIE
ncbi:MAG: hypothetical protein ACTSVI_11525 [Promethearchaeota archaeon]